MGLEKGKAKELAGQKYEGTFFGGTGFFFLSMCSWNSKEKDFFFFFGGGANFGNSFCNNYCPWVLLIIVGSHDRNTVFSCWQLFLHRRKRTHFLYSNECTLLTAARQDFPWQWRLTDRHPHPEALCKLPVIASILKVQDLQVLQVMQRMARTAINHAVVANKDVIFLAGSEAKSAYLTQSGSLTYFHDDGTSSVPWFQMGSVPLGSCGVWDKDQLWR